MAQIHTLHQAYDRARDACLSGIYQSFEHWLKTADISDDDNLVDRARTAWQEAEYDDEQL